MRSGFWLLLCSFLPVSLSLASDEATPWRWSNVARVVVVPDIHGAFAEFRELLKSSGVIDDSLHWTGGDTHLVSLGDLLDRGSESRKVMDLLMRLQNEAPEQGDYVHVVAGNHEMMKLNEENLATALGQWLNRKQQLAILARRDALLARWDSEGAKLKPWLR